MKPNHNWSSGVWLVSHKEVSNKTRVSDGGAEEVRCFGWIDGRPTRRGNESYLPLFSPRTLRSSWSKANQQRIDTLIARWLMTPAGIPTIKDATYNDPRQADNAVEALSIPVNLERRCRANAGESVCR